MGWYCALDMQKSFKQEPPEQQKQAELSGLRGLTFVVNPPASKQTDIAHTQLASCVCFRWGNHSEREENVAGVVFAFDTETPSVLLLIAGVCN